MESKKINQLATELAPELSDLTIIGDPTTGISKKITLSQMASLFTGTVEEYASLSAFPLVGTADTIYIALDTNILYRWNTGTSAYVELSPNVVSSLVFNDANGFDGTISLVGSVATLTITTALTQGSVPFIGASGALTQDNTNFFWDNSNKRLGINTNTPTGALDVFGSGIIGRLNGTSTNNAFLGFASAGSNKWSIGNVQSDHRFRIYNEAATSELFTVLPTGEIGIGIANPLTKLHIDGGASALIANLDANVSVAKSVSFRSDNSSRFNIEVSGTESGSNAGMDLFIRRYSDAGALIDTPLTISRSTGAATFSSSITATGATFTSTQTNLVLNTTTNTSFTKLSFQENGSEKATITYPNSTFGAPTRREKLEISNLGGINFITQNAPLTPNLTINSSGNVSIGNTNDTYKLDISGTLRVTGASLFSSSIGATSATFSDTVAITLTASDSRILGGNSTGRLLLANSGTSTYGIFYGASHATAPNAISFATDNTERMRITSSGNVGIGTTSPASLLEVKGATPFIRLTDTSASSETGFIMDNTGGFIRGGLTINHSTGEFKHYCGVSGNSYFQTFLTNGLERMRINSDGRVLINTTSFAWNTVRLQVNASGGTNEYGASILLNDGSGNPHFMNFNIGTGSAGVKGSITYNGTNTLYNGTSDYRLKEDLKDYNALSIVQSIKTYDFKWKESEMRDYGVMAHELQEIMPNIVTGKKDEVDDKGNMKVQGVDYSKIVPVLVKAIQELKTEIDILKAK